MYGETRENSKCKPGYFFETYSPVIRILIIGCNPFISTIGGEVMKNKSNLLPLPFLSVFLLLLVTAPHPHYGQQPLPYLDQLPPLIDREIFFDDPEIVSGQLSPNGEFVTFRRQLDGVMNIWIKGIDEPFENARPVTAETERPVPGYFWSRDSRYILYVNDQDGDENFNVYAVDPLADIVEETGVPPSRNLTDLEDVRAQIYSVPRNTPDYMIIGLNDRDRRYHDVYRFHIESGEKELLYKNEDEIIGWNVDDDGNLRFATRQTGDGGTEILQYADGAFEQVYEVAFEESAGIVRLHEDGEHVYLVTNKGDDVDLMQFVLFNPATGEKTLIEKDPEGEVDFAGATFSNVTDELLATYYIGDRRRMYFHNDRFEQDYEIVRDALPEGDISFGSRTDDESLWLVSVTRDVDPGATYLYNRETGEVTFQYRPRPDLPTEHLAGMVPLRYTARDGLEIQAYLTVPQGVEPENLAVIILPHGGPWARDTWGYRSEAQFFANRGYAVFQPNFRGSTGFGKEFLNAGNKEWGTGYMQHDITDGVQYLIEEGIADPERIGIYGGSYGGFATLAGLAFTPELYAAGVSFVGPSNIITLLESIPPYWEPAIKMFHKRVGNPDDPEDHERLKEQSPLFSAEQIQAPLLVVQGANDPRVKQHESDQIVVAMRELGREVEYIVAPDEGHGFRRPENRIAFYVAMEEFFAQHLGGRYQEDVPDNIAERLDEITVDIADVELREPVVGLEEAKTAPLPAFNTELLAPKTVSYSSEIDMHGQKINITSTRKINRTIYDEREAWRIIESAETPMGASEDTIYLDYKTLKPIYRSATQGMATIKMSYTDNGISGVIVVQGQESKIETELDAPVLSDGAAIDLALLALPLDVGFETTYRTYDIMNRKTGIKRLEVVGRESVDVPAGTFEAYKLKIETLDNGGGERTVWVSVEEPRGVMKSIDALPAAMGGGTVTTRLDAMEMGGL